MERRQRREDRRAEMPGMLFNDGLEGPIVQFMLQNKEVAHITADGDLVCDNAEKLVACVILYSSDIHAKKLQFQADKIRYLMAIAEKYPFLTKYSSEKV